MPVADAVLADALALVLAAAALVAGVVPVFDVLAAVVPALAVVEAVVLELADEAAAVFDVVDEAAAGLLVAFGKLFSRAMLDFNALLYRSS